MTSFDNISTTFQYVSPGYLSIVTFTFIEASSDDRLLDEEDGLLVEPFPVGSLLSSDDGFLDEEDGILEENDIDGNVGNLDENDGPLVSLLLSSYDGLLGVDGESDEREFPVSSDVSFVS